jgi:hypothetical protein
MIAFINDHRGVHGVEPICKVLPIAPSTYWADVAKRADPASGLRLTFESRRGFPGEWMHASLAHANRNFHHS